MAYPDDYSDNYPPWGKRLRLVPIRTYSGRVVYKRKPNHFTMADVVRITDSIEPPDDADESWVYMIIQQLRAATIKMLGRILWYLPDELVMALYDWCLEMIDLLLRKVQDANARRRAGIGLITRAADLSDVVVSIK